MGVGFSYCDDGKDACKHTDTTMGVDMEEEVRAALAKGDEGSRASGSRTRGGEPVPEGSGLSLLRKGLEKSRPSKDMLWLDIALLTAGGVMSLALMVCGCYFGCRSTFQPEADVVAPKKGADARAEIVVREDDQRV